MAAHERPIAGSWPRRCTNRCYLLASVHSRPRPQLTQRTSTTDIAGGYNSSDAAMAPLLIATGPLLTTTNGNIEQTEIYSLISALLKLENVNTDERTNRVQRFLRKTL